MTPVGFWDGVKVSDLAARLDLSRQAVYLWQKRDKGVPAERVSQVAEILGVAKEDIRPDLFL